MAAEAGEDCAPPESQAASAEAKSKPQPRYQEGAEGEQGVLLVQSWVFGTKTTPHGLLTFPGHFRWAPYFDMQFSWAGSTRGDL